MMSLITSPAPLRSQAPHIAPRHRSRLLSLFLGYAARGLYDSLFQVPKTNRNEETWNNIFWDDIRCDHICSELTVCRRYEGCQLKCLLICSL
ncbi:hypothetical protein L1887_01002 [Cichorium endivia]|nr:hypothetical protein L1887_01002 [Cichorium endivia]